MILYFSGQTIKLSHAELLLQNLKENTVSMLLSSLFHPSLCVLFLFLDSWQAAVSLKKKKKSFFFIDAESLQDVKQSGKNCGARRRHRRRRTRTRDRSALVEMTASANVSSRAKNAPVHIFLSAAK